MPSRLFDTNVLIKQLKKLRQTSTQAGAVQLAGELIEVYKTNAIVSPVEIEILAGVRDPRELDLTQAFLACFEVIDQQKIPPKDWQEAKRHAKRVVEYDREVPRKGRKRKREQYPRTEMRKLGDSPILAIAKRLQRDIISNDKDIPRQIGRARSER